MNTNLDDLKKLYNNNMIVCDRPLLAMQCHVQLPKEFILSSFHVNENLITKNKNIYSFKGIGGNRIIIANKCVPCSLFNDIPIPFSFPIVCKEQNTEIIQSNVYYYEVTITNNVNINNTWPSQCISVGFATNETPVNSHIGWFADSIGYHSDDGTVRYNNSGGATIISRTWDVNDTVGAGIIYVSKNTFKYFFTLNGKIMYMSENPVCITKPYFPAIGYDHPNSISINLSTSEFKFNLKKFIVENNTGVINTESKSSNDNIDDFYLNEHLNYKKNIPNYYIDLSNNKVGKGATYNNNINNKIIVSSHALYNIYNNIGPTGPHQSGQQYINNIIGSTYSGITGHISSYKNFSGITGSYYK